MGIISSPVLGQESDEDLEVANMKYSIDMFPKTPDAAALSKFVDIPPGNYTGVAAFSIPIYTISVDGIEFPIELAYSTMGVKVGEISSRVGLGWALNAGGVSLSRQIMGTPDSDIYNRPVIDLDFSPDGDYLINPDTYTACEILALGPMFNLEKPIDVLPDIYSYQLPTNSGRFIIDSEKRTGIPLPYNQLKITPMPTNGKLEIIDENGTIYDFGIDPGTKSYNTCETSITPFSLDPDPNYKISKITTVKNQEIKFFYNKYANTLYATSLVKQNLLDRKTYGNTPIKLPDPIPIQCLNSTSNLETILTEIKFPKGKILFKYNDETQSGSERLDLPGDFYLTQIIVEDLNGNQIKKVSLEHSYFLSPEPQNLSSLVSGRLKEGLDKRLKLTKVKDEMDGGEYKLEYYEEHLLPHRLSNSQDYWGIYNGEPNTETSIPTTLYRIENFSQNPFKLFLGANKWPNFDFGVTGNLKKITYPTNGYTEIVYEADDFIQGEHRPIKIDEFLPKGADISTTQTGNESFEIEKSAYEMTINFHPDDPNYDPDSEPGTANIGNCNLNIYKNGIQDPIFSNMQYGKFHKYDSFDIGNYELEITPGIDLDGNTVNCVASLRWYERNIINDSLLQKAGTLRVKEIKLNDGNNGKIHRKFTYLDPNSNYSQSSGRNLGEEYFIAINTNESAYGNTGGTKKDIIITNNPGWQLSTVRGKSIGYDYVQEVYIDSLKSFKKEYKFHNDLDDQWANHDPYAVINYKWPIEGIKRGLLLNEKFFDENKLVKEIAYDYNFNTYFNKNSSAHIEGVSIVGYGMDLQLKSITDLIFTAYLTFNKAIFPIWNYWIQTPEVITTEYLDNKEFITYTSKEYQTNEPEHPYPIRNSTVNSDGSQINIDYQYPQDLPNRPYATDLIAANRLINPLVVKTNENNLPVSVTETVYKKFDGSNLILPKFIFMKKQATELDNTIPSDDLKITYDSYDTKGNLTQYTLANGTPVSIIWGYEGQYPIAKVEGKNYTEIASEFNIFSLQNASIDGSINADSFEGLRNIEGAMVTGYIYKPLVGVTQIIHPNGQVANYEYDGAGRLQQVKDQDGKILKEVEYHYQPQ